ncbi:hypothetical protein JCM10207_005907 [Rhodosporidiobolus poonsookiae]
MSPPFVPDRWLKARLPYGFQYKAFELASKRIAGQNNAGHIEVEILNALNPVFAMIPLFTLSDRLRGPYRQKATELVEGSAAVKARIRMQALDFGGNSLAHNLLPRLSRRYALHAGLDREAWHAAHRGWDV